MSSHREFHSEILPKLPDALVRMAPSHGPIQDDGGARGSRATLSLLTQFQIDNARRRVAQIEALITDFDRMANALESEIRAEQDRTGIHDPAHFAYPTYAKATIARRNNLRRSIDGLKDLLDAAKGTLAEALFGIDAFNDRRTTSAQG